MIESNYGVAPLLKLQEAAAYLRISDMTLYRLIRQKQIPYIRLGHAYVFHQVVLDKWLDERMEDAS